MSLIRYLKAMVLFARFQPWVDEPQWEPADNKHLGAFLVTPTGQRFKAQLLNLVLRQQASAINSTKDLEFNAGFAVGQRALVAGIDSMAADTLTEQGETDADHAAN